MLEKISHKPQAKRLNSIARAPFEAKQKALIKVLVLGGAGGYCPRVHKVS